MRPAEHGALAFHNAYIALAMYFHILGQRSVWTQTQYLRDEGSTCPDKELPCCESTCECSAHLFLTKSVGGHTQRAPNTSLPWCGCAGIFLPLCQGDSHQLWLCTTLSSQASMEIKTQKCLSGRLFRGRTDAVCQDLASEAFEKCATFWRSTYTRCKCSKNCTWICLSPQFPCRQALREISGAALCYLHAS